MSRELPLALLLGGIALASSYQPALAQAESGTGFDVTSYQLDLAPDILDKTVVGRETITLRATIDGLRRLDFSDNALVIDRARLDGVAIGVGLRGNGLRFDLPAPLRRGATVKLDLSFHGRPARGLTGSANALYTSYFACDWMICAQDAFGDKAAFTIDLHVPRGVDSLSVGRLTARRPGPNGSEIHRWTAPRPYSAYLFGFAIGRFARASETIGPAKLTYLSDNYDKAELERRFAATREISGFFAEKAGVALPVAEYSQLLVEGDEAQEAATYSVLGADSLPAKPDDPAEDWAIAHELAHQWWGNLLTCATLRDFWLNEGITTFMTAAWKERRYGPAAYEAELDVAKNRLARARAAGFDKPLAGQAPTQPSAHAARSSIAKARFSWRSCAPRSAMPLSGRACVAIRVPIRAARSKASICNGPWRHRAGGICAPSSRNGCSATALSNSSQGHDAPVSGPPVLQERTCPMPRR